MSPSTGSLPISFHDAVARMRSLLKSHGRPEAIVWITPDDVIASKSRLRVRVRDPNRRWMDAQCKYELGLERKLGVVLTQICEAPGISCCHVYIPKNATDAAQQTFTSGLRLALAPESRRARPVTNRLQWTWLKMTGRPATSIFS